MKPAAVDHSATRCRDRRLFTNARIELMAAIRYAATAASSKDRIGKHHSKPGHKEAQKKREEVATKRHKRHKKKDSSGKKRKITQWESEDVTERNASQIKYNYR